MDMIWVVLGLMVLAGLGLLVIARRGGPAPRSASGSAARRPPAARPVPPAPPPQPLRPSEPPAALAGFTLGHLRDLPADRHAGYLQVFKDVPRPPRLMQHLLSPEFFDTASSAQLVDLISAEPLIAAKVLATVNSPFYGLSRPVTGIGQAVTLLGLNAVRSLCVQHLLRASFLPDGEQRKALLEDTWAASALASELAQRLSLAVGLEERGALVSAVVLSFLGRLAVLARTPLPIVATIPARDLLARATAEQARLGLPASEIGRLLMTAWELPPSVVADAADIDRCLVDTPAGDARGNRLALGYLCARLGERLAADEVDDLQALDLMADAGPELFHWLPVTERRPFAKLAAALQAADLHATLMRMRTALRG